MKLKSLALAAMVALGGYAAAAQAAETPAGPHISTSGSAVIQAEPDMATLSINVTVKEKDASAAKAQADKRVAQYFDFLKAQGIERKTLMRPISVPVRIMSMTKRKKSPLSVVITPHAL